MLGITRKRRLGNARGRCIGAVPRDGSPLVICDGCRWPFPAVRSGGNFRRVCRDCRSDEADRIAGLLRRLAQLRVLIRDGCEARPPEAEFEARLERYAARAALGLPVCDPRPAAVSPDRVRYLTPNAEAG